MFSNRRRHKTHVSQRFPMPFHLQPQPYSSATAPPPLTVVETSYEHYREEEYGAIQGRGIRCKGEIIKTLKENNNEHTWGNVTVKLAQAYGFCWDVECAVQIAYEARKQFPDEKIWITNEIIHNPTVNKVLWPMGEIIHNPTVNKMKFDGGYVHNGLLKASEWVFENECEVLKELVERHEDYTLTFAGHLLGAGVVTLLTILAVKNWERIRIIERK
ncbi:hypothetical protein L1987_53272 [Smallanthus sonchifolius]|uniref:Uncharacterized protein n=1 Tax=Smallanthus sonchifolius TaxID=185202 RepID=A0ACB9EW21_9ASTR|nr:hypothetical protein L1987_53272 [Smallanthus sonchifolius]